MVSREDHFKIVLLGEGRVGKTSLVRRYMSNTFSDKEESTVQANMFQKKKLVIDDRSVNIAIWDTAGQERFHALGPIYYRDSHGALLVYDITDADTFDKVKNWVRELKKVVGDDIQLAVAGNKCDLERQRQVSVEDAMAYCKSVGAVHFATSAKLDRGVADAFLNLTQRMVHVRQKQQSDNPTKKALMPTGSKKIKIIQEDVPSESAKPSSGGGCCGGGS